MDIAGLSVVMAQSEVRANAGVALMDKVMNMADQQGSQLANMLGESTESASHPTLGKTIDIHI
ncbi:YjfB family protein [Oceanobacillus halophilus]|uniref:Putative motility protein n=1 Tax=Oceanobacillus halophilus TaxID=930130 RepID=A0A495A448_9BACI|nr:YjfB family protein [Oceanobacillus halophilus]RKQ34350.1 putative motility protein [Oceanobacillus halophilus]